MGSQYDEIQKVLDDYKKELPKIEQDLSSEASAQEDWPPKVQRALTCIHDHIFDSRLTVSWMMQKCRINGHNFSSRFKYFLGKTPKQNILHHRMQAAKQLLAHPKLQDISISAFRFAVGFSSAASFSKKNR